MNRLAREDGFSLVELLVGAVLMIIVMSASLTTLDQLRQLGTRTDDRVALQDEARQVSRQLTRSLRNVAPSPAIPTVIERSGAEDLVFRAVDRPRDSGENTRNLRRVRYCLDTTDPNNARLLEPGAAPGSPEPGRRRGRRRRWPGAAVRRPAARSAAWGVLGHVEGAE
jgi:type II secretory pathway pseudopilin PulG